MMNWVYLSPYLMDVASASASSRQWGHISVYSGWTRLLLLLLLVLLVPHQKMLLHKRTLAHSLTHKELAKIDARAEMSYVYGHSLATGELDKAPRSN